MGTLQKLTTLVTGGASGLGRATVERFAKAGSRVAICDLPSQADSATSLISELSVDKSKCIFTPCDITSEKDMQNTIGTIKENFQRLDVLVNCAGRGVAFKTYNFNKNLPHSLEDFQMIINVNLVGTFNAIRLAVGLIGENEPDEDGFRGVVVNTASVAAFDGQMGQAAYASSKGGIVGLTLPLARDLGTQGIRVVTLAPGVFDTPLLQTLPPKIKKFLGGQTVFPKRLGGPAEFAQMVQSVVENPYVNAEVIRVDAGLRMQ